MTDTPNATTDGQLYMAVHEADSATVYKIRHVLTTSLGYRTAECEYDLNGNTIRLAEMNGYDIINGVELVKLMLTTSVPVYLAWQD